MDWHHLVAWGLFLVFVLAMLAFDLFVLHKEAHEIRFKEALLGTLLPLGAALIFGVGLYFVYESHWMNLGIIPQHVHPKDIDFYPDTGFEAVMLFITGYVVELSLSADNVFLFVVLMRFFSVEPHLQHRVLFWGVIGALVMRAVMIAAGSALLTQFSWIIYVFGLFIVYAGIKMFFTNEETQDPSKSLAVRMARKLLPIHPGFVGEKFFTRIDGKRFATTLFLVLVAIEFTDLIFALDSIPAIFGITRDPFIVFTSNVFAILGLRSMYFLLIGVIDKFHLLKYGLAFVLAFVGVKMILPGAGDLYGRFVSGHEEQWHLNQYVALGAIAGALGLSVVLSLAIPKKHHAKTA